MFGAADEDQITLNGLYDVYLEFEDNVEDLSVGLPNNTIGVGKFEAADVGTMRFTVERDLIIKEVSVYADCPGTVVISLLDGDGNTVGAPVHHEITEEGVKQSIPLNLFVHPITDGTRNEYTLSAAGSNVRLYMSIKADFPFVEEGLISLLPGRSHETTRENYYYFYDWKYDFPDLSVDAVPTTYTTRAHGGMAERGNYPGAYESPADKRVLFDVERPLILHGLYIYGDQPGDVEVTVYDFRNAPLRTTPVRIAGEGRKTWVPLELNFEIGQHFSIKASSSRVRLYANQEASFPYVTDDTLVLIGGLANGEASQQYYFFYDWEFTYEKLVGATPAELPNTKSSVTRQALNRLLACRNLGEDLVCIKELKPEEVGLCGDIVLSPDADPEQVLAEIYFKFDEHLKPDVIFYTIDELLAKGRTMDEIFEGPALDCGFIDDEQLASIEQKKADPPFRRGPDHHGYPGR